VPDVDPAFVPSPAAALAGVSARGAVLEADGLTVRFSGLTALDDVAIRVDESEVLGLIGPNGAGKTTLVNVLSGFQSSTGRVLLRGSDITSLPSHHRARRGLRRSFQSARLFADLSVFDNVLTSALASGAGRHMARESAHSALDWAGLARHGSAMAGSLPYGRARWLAVARTLVCSPAVILVDEPAAGLNESESAELGEALARVPAEFGASVVLIEHDVSLVMNICHRVHVLDNGSTIAIGTPAEVRGLRVVQEAYLGTDVGSAPC
jgi:branched-chain amino acid transport system ATP-binding protein